MAMNARRLTVLALAARCSRVGYVLIVDGLAKDWALSRVASLDPQAASTYLAGWIDRFNPNVIVLEDYQSAGRKADRTKTILKALQHTAATSSAVVTSLVREQTYPNKFVEAHDLVERFPELAAWVPRRPRLWEREPRNLVYFEALALAVQSGVLPNEGA